MEPTTEKTSNGHGGTSVPRIDQALVKEANANPGKDMIGIMGKGLIYHKMVAIMKEIGAVGKDQQNTVQNFKFRGIDQFINALHPACVKHGVFVNPQNVSYKSELKEVTRSNGKAGVDKHVELLTSYTFIAEDGSSVTLGPIPAEGLDSGDKATNKALSAGLKYLLIQTFLVPTEDMAEGDADNPEHGAPAKKEADKAPPATTSQPRRGGFTAPQRGADPKAETPPPAAAQSAPAPAAAAPVPTSTAQPATTTQESAPATSANTSATPPAATTAPAQAAVPATAAATEPEKPKRERARFNPPSKTKREE
jgi:hypothetical protein